MDPKQLAPVLSNVTASADKLAACPTVKEALAAILRDEKITLADQIPYLGYISIYAKTPLGIAVVDFSNGAYASGERKASRT